MEIKRPTVNADGYIVVETERNKVKRVKQADIVHPLHPKKPYEREQDKIWNPKEE